MAQSIVKLKASEIEQMIIDLAKQNVPAEKIGLILRDQHGVPKARLITNKKISQILKESGFKTNSEEVNISKKIDNLRKHIENNKQDYTAKQKLTKRLAHLRKVR